MDAHPGASSTVSPGRAMVVADSTTRSMRSSSPVTTSTTGTSGACRRSASATTARSAADQHDAAQPVAGGDRPGRRTSRPWPGRRRSRPPSRRPAATRARRAGWWPWSRRRTARRRSRRRGRCGAGRRGTTGARHGRLAGCTPCDRASAAAASALATTCGAGSARSSTRAELGRRGLPVVDERPVGEHVVDEPDHAGLGKAEGEPDGAGALDDVGLADQPLGPRVLARCRRRPARRSGRCGPWRRRRPRACRASRGGRARR